jgi:benzoyl-CoA reductase/2-hydroxyglutaryl-CoA dehydratase subunit BcrC/BadD/HgdB
MRTEPFQIYPKYKELSADYYARLGRARQEGKTLAWGVVMLPAEILRAMDIEPVLGEPYSAVCTASGFAPEFTAATENYGFRRDFCAYSRNFIGSFLLNKGPLGEMPAPDLIIGFKTGCNDHLAWFETLSQITGKPFFGIDMPLIYEDITERHLRYVEAQLENFIAFLEKVTGRKLEEERLIEAVTLSHEARELWTEIVGYCRNTPCPMNFRNQLSFMMPAVSLRGTRGAVEFYRELRDELKERVRRGVAAAAEEKVRLLWDNVPPWYYMQLFGYLDQQGAVIVVSPYVALFGVSPPLLPSLSARGRKLIQWKKPASLEEAVREVAKDFLRHMTYESLPAKLASYDQMVKEFGVQAALFHANRGCKTLSLNRKDAARYVEQKLGIPVLVFEGSNADPTHFDEAGTVARINAFLERVLPRAG